MIKYTEVRIGNFLNLEIDFDANGNKIGLKPGKVLQISESGFYWGMVNQKSITDGYNGGSWDVAEGVPLTPEILEQCGFEKYNFIRFELDISEKISGLNKHLLIYVLDTSGLNSVLTYKVNGFWASVNIKYLHQFQNLYFALTGQELEIKLTA